MANGFLGKDHLISSEEAKKMIDKFKIEKDKIVKVEHVGKHLIPHYESFDRAAFDALLQREDCRGVRIYYGMKEEDLRVHAIIVGIDTEGKDILPINGATDSTPPPIIENGQTCPPYCD